VQSQRQLKLAQLLRVQQIQAESLLPVSLRMLEQTP